MPLNNQTKPNQSFTYKYSCVCVINTSWYYFVNISVFSQHHCQNMFVSYIQWLLTTSIFWVVIFNHIYIYIYIYIMYDSWWRKMVLTVLQVWCGVMWFFFIGVEVLDGLCLLVEVWEMFVFMPTFWKNFRFFCFAGCFVMGRWW